MSKEEQNPQPITREELRELLTALRNEIRNDTQEFVRGAQTEILRGFHGFEQNREIRFSRLKAEVANLDQEANGRIDNIDKRLVALEEKLILWPPKQQ